MQSGQFNPELNNIFEDLVKKPDKDRAALELRNAY